MRKIYREAIGSDDKLVVMCSWYFDKQNLKLRWINARWRLHLPNDDQWRARVENILKRYPKYT